MKTFKDLEFKPHPIGSGLCKNSKGLKLKI